MKPKSNSAHVSHPGFTPGLERGSVHPWPNNRVARVVHRFISPRGVEWIFYVARGGSFALTAPQFELGVEIGRRGLSW
jgi:hypothetical protein